LLGATGPTTCAVYATPFCPCSRWPFFSRRRVFGLATNRRRARRIDESAGPAPYTLGSGFSAISFSNHRLASFSFTVFCRSRADRFGKSTRSIC